MQIITSLGFTELFALIARPHLFVHCSYPMKRISLCSSLFSLIASCLNVTSRALLNIRCFIMHCKVMPAYRFMSPLLVFSL